MIFFIKCQNFIRTTAFKYVCIRNYINLSRQQNLHTFQNWATGKRIGEGGGITYADRQFSRQAVYIHFAVDLIVVRVNHRYNLQYLSGNWFPLILFRFLCSYYTFSRIRESVLRDQKNFINSRRAVDICGVHLIYSQEQLRHCFQRWPTTKKVICTKFYDSIRGHRINLVGLSGHIRKLDSDILGEDTAHLSSQYLYVLQNLSTLLVSNCRLIFTKVVKYNII